MSLLKNMVKRNLNFAYAQPNEYGYSASSSAESGIRFLKPRLEILRIIDSCLIE